ncbi:uncharacterized protein Dana_GF21324, isoform A [Drosophila ananassae]|uniref:26S proteasome non-ATPase regulatory subunit 5 n=1 Tax=Drosophila ananassae TaxID=7217 RepID=B3MRN9_DROAN|nr:26S proteasome non-ATPase regulatory subunit 5 isoform X1 [Drosophila ananassae]EDV34444.1 uncharacterized protein Dana_GF21324, isoform A [Drosophila ananassae]
MEEESWWVDQLRALKSPNQRLSALNSINTAFTQEMWPRGVVRTMLKTPELYDCIDRSGGGDSGPGREGVSGMAVEVLNHCLNQLPLDITDEQLPDLLEPGLTNSNPVVRSLVLRAILTEVNRQYNSGRVRELPGNELVCLVLDELKRPDTEESTVAIEILSIVLHQRVNDGAVQAKLVQLLQQDEIVRCRAYELGVKLAKSSAATLKSVEFILDAALSELDNDDVLLQASVMEVLVPLAEQNHGLSYMERRNVFDVINNRVQRIEENPLDALLIPSIMKFFGKIAAVQPQKIIIGYPNMLDCLFQQLQSENEVNLPTAMDTLANLAATSQGKQLLHKNFQQSMEMTLKKYASYTKNLSAPIKERLLNSLDVIYAVESKPPSQEISTILKNWYEIFAGGLQIQIIMDLINTPFPDLQIAALALLKSICQYRFGIVALKNTGGAMEFLLSRRRDLHKEVKYLKWEIMEMLAVSTEFSPTETIRFTAYVNEGPYHIQPDLDIATEPQGRA